jgi:hypothetical protein
MCWNFKSVFFGPVLCYPHSNVECEYINAYPLDNVIYHVAKGKAKNGLEHVRAQDYLSPISQQV